MPTADQTAAPLPDDPHESCPVYKLSLLSFLTGANAPVLDGWIILHLLPALMFAAALAWSLPRSSHWMRRLAVPPARGRAPRFLQLCTLRI